MAGKYKIENLEQKEAFERYYAMGEKRDVREVAPFTSKSARTVYEWSRQFNWAERIQQRDIEIGKAMEKKTNSTVIDEKANYRKIIKASLMDFTMALRDGNVKIRTIADFERLVKLDLLLMGEPTSVEDVRST